jgi:hypothetical protein
MMRVMSRGLGRNQRIFLAALQALEASNGPGWFYVHAVLRAAWPLGADAAERREADRAAAWKREDARLRADAAERAAAGDMAAVELMETYQRLDFLASTIRYALRRRDQRGRWQLRPSRDAERDLNPSRILAQLERRGLLKRSLTRRGGLSTVRLTPAGRSLLSGQQTSDT